jgi:hypothetical protein
MNKSIPDTNDITFMDVYMLLRKDMLRNIKYRNIKWIDIRLSDILKIANDDYYDPRYKNHKDSLLSFRNYGVHNSRRKKINNICKRIKQKITDE